MRSPREAPSASEQPEQEVRRLGEELEARVDQVLALTAARGPKSGRGSRASLDPAVIHSFERIGRRSTIALARWMAGGNPQDGRQTGRHAWDTYGQLAAQSAAPLNEVTKRCLRWRDAVIDTLRASAAELGVCEAALAQATAMTQRVLDVTLVRICEAFERERERIERELVRRDEELTFIATHDRLTGLPNRTLILDRGTQMLGRARRRQAPVAALVIDMDNFTSINDTLGHSLGDELLRAIAARLDEAVRDIDGLARLGGDLFAVLAEDLCTKADAELVAGRLKDALKAPFMLDEHDHTGLTVSASIGVAIGEHATVEDLLRDADIAMHRAKHDGKNRLVVFESGMQDVLQSRMKLEMNLRGALSHDQFFLVYQPTFDLLRMVPTGVEALIRWRSDTRGVVAPNDFIPLLEETGLIVDVGRWVLQEACRQGARWRACGHELGVAVNVSPRQLETDEFIADVRNALERNGLQAHALTLEITETTLMRNPDQTARRLRAIKDLGVRIAVDDFGTGYSSLSHLQRFPVDSLKIDRSFISQMSESSEAETLLRTLVKLGKALAIETLAEGIEREPQLSLLQEELCDAGQGYLFARPLEAHAAEAFLQSWRTGEPPLTPAAQPTAAAQPPAADTPAAQRGAPALAAATAASPLPAPRLLAVAKKSG
ncbi:MAG TPA: EAL domain-containing protein [Solirubrobacteraceae bacterium]|nr:EAL domain-containing protein [Solirubrobacteraceae bacterium]